MDHEFFARDFVTHFTWQQRGAWLNTRIRTLERMEQAMRREAHGVSEGSGPYTLADAQKTIEDMRTHLADLSDALAAIVAMRERLSRPNY